MSKGEHGEQVTLVNWFRASFPTVVIFAIPNGGHRAKSVGKALRDEGVMAGVPDLYIPAWRTWIEMKRENGGRLSAEQVWMLDYLASIGDRCIVAHGWRDAVKQIMEVVK